MSDFQVMVDLDSACLVCLQNSDEKVSIHAVDEEQSKLTIRDKILRCSNLEWRACESPSFPDQICVSCMTDLTAAWRFRLNCDTANAVFRLMQQHDADAEREANNALKQHRIKLPSGLKIKKVEPESKTFYLPIAVEAKTETESIVEETIVEEEQLLEDDVVEEVQEESVQNEDITSVAATEVYEIVEDGAVTEISQTEYEELFEGEGEEEHLDDSEPEDREFHALNNDSASESITNEINNILTPKRRGRPKKVLKTVTLIEESIKDDVKEQPTLPIEIQSSNSKPTKVKTGNNGTSAASRKRKGKSGVRPPKICDICGNSYKYQHALNAHVRRHTNERPYPCEFCDKAFVSGVELRRHLRVHTGHKPYSCQYCQRSFSDFGSRIKHERTHTGERPYICKTCGKCFAYAHVLSVHVRTHTGEKRFQCNICGKGFTKKVYLEGHLQQHLRAERDEKLMREQNVSMEEFITTTTIVEEDNENESVEEMEEEVGFIMTDFQDKQEYSGSDGDVVEQLVVKEEEIDGSEEVEYVMNVG